MHSKDPNWFLRARLRTRQLLVLVAIDDERNIHRAAELVHVSQPAISKLLKDLEDSLGVSLFERNVRGMTPTKYGESLIRYARMALSTLMKAHEDISALKSGAAGRVEFGIVHPPAINVVPAIVTELKERSPALQIGIQLESSDMLLEKLRRGTIDFMIARLFVGRDNSDLDFERLGEEPVCVVARVGHPLAQQTRLALHDLAAAGWILQPAGSALREKVDDMFRAAGLEPPLNLIETTSVLVVKCLLEKTDYLHVMPVEEAEYYARYHMLEVLPITLSCNLPPFGIVSRKNEAPSPAASILIEAIREAYRK